MIDKFRNILIYEQILDDISNILTDYWPLGCAIVVMNLKNILCNGGCQSQYTAAKKVGNFDCLARDKDATRKYETYFKMFFKIIK